MSGSFLPVQFGATGPGRFFKPAHAANYAPASALLLLTPLLVALSLGFIYPLIRLVGLSLAEDGHEYRRLFETPLYLEILGMTVMVAASVSLLCLLLGYPVAYLMAKRGAPSARLAGVCVFISLWTSVLIRSYAWIVLLQRNGLINDLLIGSGLSDTPIKLLYNQGAVVVGMTHMLLPFAILPIHSNLTSLPEDYQRAAANLGASSMQAFLRVTLPLSLPGIFAGFLLTFVLALGFYITPALLGGPGSMLMATLISQQTIVTLDWPFAAALSTVLLFVTLTIVFLFRKALSRSRGFHSVH